MEFRDNDKETNDKKKDPDKLPVPRLFVYPEDIARMTGRKMSDAKALYYRIRRKLKKKKGAEITVKEYCHYVQVWEEEVQPYMRMPLTLKILLVALLLYSFSRLAVNRFPQLKELFGVEGVQWQEERPGYQRGSLRVKDAHTGQPSTVTIEVEEVEK